MFHNSLVFPKKLILYIGSAMAFMTHHDYGGAYLIPAFVAWLSGGEVPRAQSGVCLLLEAVAWFFVFTPLQIPNPVFAGSLNAMLQNESLFLLLAVSLVPVMSAVLGVRKSRLQPA